MKKKRKKKIKHRINLIYGFFSSFYINFFYGITFGIKWEKSLVLERIFWIIGIFAVALGKIFVWGFHKKNSKATQLFILDFIGNWWVSRKCYAKKIYWAVITYAGFFSLLDFFKLIRFYVRFYHFFLFLIFICKK